MKCEKCGKPHATFEHRIYEKLKDMESGKEVAWLVLDTNGTHITRLVGEDYGKNRNR